MLKVVVGTRDRVCLVAEFLLLSTFCLRLQPNPLPNVAHH